MADRAASRISPTTEAAASEDLNQYRITQHQFDAASQYVEALNDGLRDYVRCTRLTIVVFPIDTDDGTVRTFVAYRALHSRMRPGKGGIRYHAGMVGVNVGGPVPRQPFRFGGWNESKFGVGDGRGSIEFRTKSKKMTAKWNKEAGVNWMS